MLRGFRPRNVAATVAVVAILGACSGSSTAASSASTPATVPAAPATQATTAVPSAVPSAASVASPASSASVVTCSEIQAKYPSLVGKAFIVGTDPSSPGYETVDPSSTANPGHIVGFDADLMHDLSDCIGFHYSYLTMTFGTLIPALQAGRVQLVMSTMYATPVRAQVVNFVAYQGVSDATLIAKGNPKNLNSLADLCGVTDAQETGTAELLVAQTQSSKCTSEGKAPIRILTFGTQDQVFTAIEEGHADITMTTPSVVDQIVQQNASKVQRGFNTELPYKVAIGVQKSDNTMLNALYDGIVMLQNNGTELSLINKWNMDPSSLVPAEIITH